MIKYFIRLTILFLLVSTGVFAQSKSYNKTTVGKSTVYKVMDYSAKGDGKNVEFIIENVENIRTHYAFSIHETTVPKSENAIL